MEINQASGDNITMAIYYDITMGNDVTRDVHCETKMGNDVARDIHCDVTMSNDIDMCTYHGITMHNDIAMKLFYYVFSALCLVMILLWVVCNKTRAEKLAGHSISFKNCCLEIFFLYIYFILLPLTHLSASLYSIIVCLQVNIYKII